MYRNCFDAVGDRRGVWFLSEACRGFGLFNHGIEQKPTTIGTYAVCFRELETK